MTVSCDWCISILVVPARSLSLGNRLLYHSPVMYLDGGHPCIHVDVIRDTCSFFEPTGVPVKVWINKLYLIPKQIIASLVAMLRNGKDLGTSESYIPVVLFDSLMQRSPYFPDVDFATLTRNHVNHAILFSRIDSVLTSHQAKCDQSAVSDLKTVQMPCGSRQSVVKRLQKQWWIESLSQALHWGMFFPW